MRTGVVTISGGHLRGIYAIGPRGFPGAILPTAHRLSLKCAGYPPVLFQRSCCRLERAGPSSAPVLGSLRSVALSFATARELCPNSPSALSRRFICVLNATHGEA